MLKEIAEKLRLELERGITTEPQVVYLLVQIRKVLELSNASPDFDALRLFCILAVHTKLSENAKAVALLREFDEGVSKLKQGWGMTRMDFLSLSAFKAQLGKFLSDFGLPSHLTERERWRRFVRLYSNVVSDCPLSKENCGFKFIDEVSISSYVVPDAPEQYHSLREGMIWLTWKVRLTNGECMHWEFLAS